MTFDPQPLSALADRLRRAGLLLGAEGVADQIIDHLAFDSREVGSEGLFVAIRGEQTDGHLFIDKAVQNGATAIACEAAPEVDWPTGVARMRVTDTRMGLAELAAACHHDPSRELRTVGVTGTNGKTTTAWLCTQALDHLGLPCGYLGTLGSGRAPSLRPGRHTTPDALTLQAFLRDLTRSGCAAVAVEVSSHALAQHRTHGVHFDVGIFTNLSRDHLDYHADFEAYASAKRILFQSMSAGGTAVVNADDPASAAVTGGTPPRLLRFGQNPGVDIRYVIRGDGVDGLHMLLDGHDGQFRLSGTFNAANLAASYGALLALGVDSGEAVEALTLAAPAPGRFEPVAAPGHADFLVDYAHTPDALANALAAARRLVGPGGKLWCVFGCGGDRDAGKRPQMGAVAESAADRVIVTSDNPRTEDPKAILSDIRSGMSRPEQAEWIVDRREAIQTAAAMAAPEDVVLVAGKGHEAYQVVGTEQIPFDDRHEILEACREVA